MDENDINKSIMIASCLACGIEFGMILAIYAALKHFVGLLCGECFLIFCLAYYIHEVMKASYAQVKEEMMKKYFDDGQENKSKEENEEDSKES